MEVKNPSFEIPGVSWGQAEDWVESQDSGAEEILEFYDGSTRNVPFENFEGGWSGNEGAQLGFGSVDLIALLFENSKHPYENFETSWFGPWGQPNHFAKLAFASTDLLALLFEVGTLAYEGFEIGWSGNENSVLGFDPEVLGGGMLFPLEFDAGVPVQYEDFEEEWYNNELSALGFRPIVPGTGVFTALLFDGGTLLYEGFEGW